LKNRFSRVAKGAGSHVVRGDGLTSTLLRVAAKMPVEPRKPPKEEPRWGERTAAHAVSDEKVANMRWMREKEGWTPKDLSQMFGVGLAYTYNILNYDARPWVKAKEPGT